MAAALVSTRIQMMDVDSFIVSCHGVHHSALIHGSVEPNVAVHPSLQHVLRKLMRYHFILSLKCTHAHVCVSCQQHRIKEEFLTSCCFQKTRSFFSFSLETKQILSFGVCLTCIS